MAILTTTVTVNAAFLREIKDDNQRLKELFAELRAVLAFRNAQRSLSRHELLERLEDLRDQLATHFALEEAFGYFDEPLVAAPRLAAKAEELRRQHADLFVQFCRLVDDAQDAYQREPHPKAFHFVGYRFEQFDDAFQAHEQAENELILEAFNADIGVGD